MDARLSVLAGILGLAGLVASCAVPRRTPDQRTFASSSVVDICPLGVPHSHVAMTEAGEILEVGFTTTDPAEVAELRARVRDQARVNGAGRHQGRGHGGEHDGTRNHGLRLWALDPVETSIVDTPTGATIRIRPLTRWEANRDALRQRVSAIEAGGCT